MSWSIDGWKNKNGTSDRSCYCGTWKQHWINYSKKNWPLICSVKGCSNSAEVGAHVYNTNISKKEYIVPMCKSCNRLTEEFYLNKDVVLVNANVSETCGK